MEPEPKAWLDIPDPLVGEPIVARGVPPPSPGVPSPTRAEMNKRRVGALVGSLVWASLALAAFGLRDELADNAGLVAGQTVLWIALVLSAVVLAVGKGQRGLGSPVGLARAVAIGAPLVFLVVGLFWLPPTTAPFGATGDFSAVVGCFTVGIAVAVPVIALALWSVRRSFPSAAGWRGALLGAASGLAAALVLTLHCASPLGGHVALAHGMPVVLASLAGAFFGSKLARS